MCVIDNKKIYEEEKKKKQNYNMYEQSKSTTKKTEIHMQ